MTTRQLLSRPEPYIFLILGVVAAIQLAILDALSIRDAMAQQDHRILSAYAEANHEMQLLNNQLYDDRAHLRAEIVTLKGDLEDSNVELFNLRVYKLDKERLWKY